MNHKHLNIDMILTNNNEHNFKKADKCYICNKKYSEKDILVRGYCYTTGKNRGLANQDCTINYRVTDKISVIVI